MLGKIAEIHLPIYVTNIIKYIIEVILSSIILVLARHMQHLVIQDRLPNRLLTSRKLWYQGWHLSGRLITNASIMLFIILHGSFLLFEFAFDSTDIPLTIKLRTELPKGQFKFGDKPLNNSYREATYWCSRKDPEGAFLYHRPRRLLDEQTTSRKYSYSQFTIIDRLGFTCPGKMKSSVAVHEKPLKIDIRHASGNVEFLLNVMNLAPADMRYFKKFNLTLAVGGIDLRIIKLMFNSFEQDLPKNDRDEFVTFYRYHGAKYIWSGVQRSEEMIIDSFVLGTSISWPVAALSVHFTLVILISILVLKASPMKSNIKEELPTDIDVPTPGSSWSNSDNPFPPKLPLNPVSIQGILLNSENDSTCNLNFHAWNSGP